MDNALDEAISATPARSRRVAMLPHMAPNHAPEVIARARSANLVLTSSREGSSLIVGFHTTVMKTAQPTRRRSETVVIQRVTTVGKLARTAEVWPETASAMPKIGVKLCTSGCVAKASYGSNTAMHTTANWEGRQKPPGKKRV
jgi:hypothetical protein